MRRGEVERSVAALHLYASLTADLPDTGCDFTGLLLGRAVEAQSRDVIRN